MSGCLIRILVFSFAAQLACPAAFADKQSPSLLKNLISELDQNIQAAKAEGKIIGTSVAVVEKGNTVFLKSYGVRKRGADEPIDADTLFQLGSISKPLAATFFAAAEKKDLVELDMPVPCPGGLDGKITASDALSHKSGIKRWGWNNKIERGLSRETMVKQLCSSKQLGVSGETFDYHNLAFSLIENLLTEMTKMSFKIGLKKYLLDPIGMSRTSAGYLELLSDTNRAWPHVAVRRRGFVPSKKYSRGYHQSAMSAGGINSCAKDMAKFLKLQFGLYPEVASLKDLKAYHDPVIRVRGPNGCFRLTRDKVQTYYGHGWRIVDLGGDRIVFHTGWVKGFTNLLAFSPKHQIGIVVLNNSESGFSFQTGMHFMRKLLQKEGPLPVLLARKKRSPRKVAQAKKALVKKVLVKKASSRSKNRNKKLAQKKVIRKKA
jgi:beta-lactamase class C